MDNQEKRGRGRPRKTMEALVSRGKVPSTWKEDIIEMGRTGKNKLHFANYLGITRNTLYRIMERDPVFLHTINYALELSEEWWVERLRSGFERETSQKVNGTLWKYYMANVYRDNWKAEEQNIDITSKGDKINPDNNIIVEIVKPKEQDEDTDNGII
jgi:hypothetical protein